MPTFSELDNLYKTTISKMPAGDRMVYCIRRLKTAKIILEKSSNILDSYQKNQVRSLIKSLEDEIENLKK